ncbi:MAG: hypothetical protein JSR77_02330 [Planctomycetes bacterium]|nr:hypothetical protein [Planctomycetota bacterium]
MIRAIHLRRAAPAALALAAGYAFAGDAGNLLFPLDASWNVVPFSANGPQGNGPAGGADPLQRNDDDFAQFGTGMPAVPFSFNLYGTHYTGDQVFVNNNGNLSFGTGFSDFTSTGFPVNGFPMVAPFWADVDTRNPLSGVVHYKFFDGNGDATPDTLAVTWDNVGYYGEHADKTNTFQVVISNGTNPRMGLGNTVCFSYDDMSWTTGDASSGSNGFGGTPATVGVNAGDGVNFFQIGRFDHEGVDYDGPGGNNDGVSFLDRMNLCFNTGEQQNQPPIAVGLPEGNCFVVLPGQELDRLLRFIGPEIGDAVTIDSFIDLNGAQGLGLMALINSPGDPATIQLHWDPEEADQGTYNFIVNFRDSQGLGSNAQFSICVTPTPGAIGLLGLAGLTAMRRRR